MEYVTDARPSAVALVVFVLVVVLYFALVVTVAFLPAAETRTVTVEYCLGLESETLTEQDLPAGEASVA